MNRIILLMVLAISINHTFAQTSIKSARVYSDDTVIGTYDLTKVDSITFPTRTDDKNDIITLVEFYKDGNILGSYNLTNIDSISLIDSATYSISFVDLGLSVKWASCNLGATEPTGTGDYYQWADTECASNKECSWLDYKFAIDSHRTLTKYMAGNEDYTAEGHITDNLSSIEMGDDAATQLLGDGYRLPTRTEVQELIDNTTKQKASLIDSNGKSIQGLILTSKINGFRDKYIFFPYTGDRANGQTRNGDTSWYIWTSDVYAPNPANAVSLNCTDYGSLTISYSARRTGYTIRAVSTK